MYSFDGRTLTLSSRADLKLLKKAFKENRKLDKLIIDYDFDSHPLEIDYLPLHRDEEGSGIGVTGFCGPFADIRLTDIRFDIEIGPKCRSLRGLFAGQNRLRRIKSICKTGHIENFALMFADCESLREVPPGLDLGKAKSIVSMFVGCTSLHEANLPHAPHVENASYAFDCCEEIRKITGLSLPSLAHATDMFADCLCLQDVSDLLAPAVTDASGMFYGCETLASVPERAIPPTADLRQIFQGCRSLERLPVFAKEAVAIHGSRLASAFSGCHSLPAEQKSVIKSHCPSAFIEIKGGEGYDKELNKFMAAAERRSRGKYLGRFGKTIVISILAAGCAMPICLHTGLISLGGIAPNTHGAPVSEQASGQTQNSNDIVSGQQIENNEDSGPEIMTSRCKTTTGDFETTLDLMLSSRLTSGKFEPSLMSTGDKYIFVLSEKDGRTFVSEPFAKVLTGTDTLKIAMRGGESANQAIAKAQPLPAEEKAAAEALTRRLAPYAERNQDTVFEFDGSDYTISGAEFTLVKPSPEHEIVHPQALRTVVRDNVSGKFMIPFPQHGRFFYLDEDGNASPTFAQNYCFESPLWLARGLKLGLSVKEATLAKVRLRGPEQ